MAPFSPVNRRRLVGATAAVLATLTALSGCSSSDGDSTDGATTEPASAYSLPAASLAQNRDWNASFDLNGSELQLTLDGVNAPQAVASFVYLADAGFFENNECHRLVTSGIFVLQCGDPTATADGAQAGAGGPGYSFGPIENAPEDNFYPAGTLAMARYGNDGESMGSQFFLVYADTTISSDAAGGYTVFGTIDSGLDVVQDIAEQGVVDGADQGYPAAGATITNVVAE
ncbi:MAG: peptidylprolyl isomerase [Glaciihabitans sp.]|nr:peptidylprolyl isomerase [Glaciihabitans sp.]